MPRRFRFRHPLVRRAVYDSASTGWRLGAHERSAEALAGRGASAAERAHHVERAGRKGDAASIAVLREAGEAEAHRAPASAAHWFAEALRLLPDDAPAEERVELLLASAGALATTGHFAEGHAAILESIELVPEDAVDLRVRLTTACAGIEHLLGRHSDAHDRLVRALESLEDRESAEAAALMIELAVDGVYRMKYDQITRWAAQAREIATSLEDQLLLASAVATMAWGAGLRGATSEAEGYRADAAELVDRLSDHELALRLDAAVNLAGAELYLDRFKEARAHAERVVTVARATGQPAFVPFAFMLLAWPRMLHGELAEGGAMLDAADRGSTPPRKLPQPGGAAPQPLTHRPRGGRPRDRGQRRPRRASNSRAKWRTVSLLRPPDSPSQRRSSRPETRSWPVPSSFSSTAAAAPGSRSCRARASARSGSNCSRAAGLPWGDPTTRAKQPSARRQPQQQSARAEWRAQWQIAPRRSWLSRRATPPRRRDRALASADAADDAGLPVEAALSRTLAGRALAQAGRTEQAVTELERAAEAFNACGARRYRDATDHELRRLGVRVHRRSQPGAVGAGGVAALTEREREVAGLVVDRRTNSEIAEILFLSPKTVETHMRNIFRKLDVSTRAEAARTVEAASSSAQATKATRP